MIDLNDGVDWPVGGSDKGRFHHRRMVPLPGTKKGKYDNFNKMTKLEKDELLNKFFKEYSNQKIPQSAVSKLPSKAGRVSKFLKRGGRAGLIAGLGAAAYEAYGYFKQKRQSRGEK